MTKYEFLNLPPGTMVKTDAILKFGRTWVGRVVRVNRSNIYGNCVQIDWCDRTASNVDEAWASMYAIVPDDEIEQEAALAALMTW